MKKMTPNGTYGDPTMASREKGEAITAAVMPALEQLLDDLGSL